MTGLPNFTIQDLMDNGVHFGHKTMRWNPKMQPFIFGSKNNIHIIDLQQTAPLLHIALKKVREVAEKNGRILFVATKRQASQIIAEEAEKCGQYYVNHRWMGGILTNWGTVSKSIKTLNTLEKRLEDTDIVLSKKERLTIQRKITKLDLALGGIRKMGGKPDLILVIDTNREKIAIQEAKKLNIPVVAVVDTNCNPDNIDYIVPGNDDSIKSIRLFANLFADAILSGISKSVSRSSSAPKANPKKAEKSKNEVSAIEAAEKPAEAKAAPKKAEVKVETKKAEVKVEAKVEAKAAPKKAEPKKAEAKPAAKKAEPAKKVEAKKAPAKKAAAKK